MEYCGREIAEYIKERYGYAPKIWLVGMQPRLLENLSMHFQIRVTDMDPDNIRSIFCRFGEAESDFASQNRSIISGVEIEKPSVASEISQWCDLIVATGTIFVNNTFEEIISCGKPVILYGVTAAGPAHVLGIQRYCPYSK
jgi:hypothetical protein